MTAPGLGAERRRAAQRAAGERLIALLIAPDRLGQTQALAHRLGVEGSRLDHARVARPDKAA